MPAPDAPEPRSPEAGPVAGHQVEVEVDLGAFLPETSAIGPVEDEGEVGATADEPAGPDEPTSPAEAITEGDGAPAPAAPPVDLSALAGIEADLAAVDRAIEAIDAGDHQRSPLLVELLGDPPA